jgi:L-lactate dehydrogenase complex protein LldG
MAGSIQNQEEFLNQIANRLGRERISSPVKRPDWKFRPQDEVLEKATQDELVEVLREQCKKIHTEIHITNQNELPTVLNDVVTSWWPCFSMEG